MAQDLIVVGGGIVGVATALRLKEALPHLEITLLDKEPALARHQTGRNSGVIHAGVYYQPGSLKARFCREGVAATIAFCRRHQLPYQQCGKLLVATDEAERARMVALHARAAANGLELERLDRAELERREPRIRGIGALLSPTTGIADYAAITLRMAELFQAAGGEVKLGRRVVALHEEPGGITVETEQESFRARYLLCCAGLFADRLARLCGIDLDFRIVPFRGEYYRLPESRNGIVRHLIYPIPDPALPFLGVHLTRMIGGYVTVGPNAVLALAREGYGWGRIDGRDLLDMAGFAGFWRVIGRNLRSGLAEAASSLARARYLKLCRRYCPELEPDDLLPHPAGVRAQAVLADGTLVHDFLIRGSARSLHVCNAPSPAATSAMPIARHLAAEAGRRFELAQ